MSKLSKIPQRGEIWLIKCDKFKEFSKDQRPFLIISGDVQNQYHLRLIERLGIASSEIMVKAKKAWEIAFDWD